MKHHWWWTSLLINLLEKTIKRDPLIDGWMAAFKDWRKKIEQGKVLEQYMNKERGDFYALMKIASYVHTSGIPLHLYGAHDGECASLYIDLLWNQQTEARHAFGGVFPEYVNRDVTVKNTKVIRRYVWQDRVKGTTVYIVVEFSREAIDGEKVDGCLVSVKMRSSYYPVEPRKIGSSQYATLSCPMDRKG